MEECPAIPGGRCRRTANRVSAGREADGDAPAAQHHSEDDYDDDCGDDSAGASIMPRWQMADALLFRCASELFGTICYGSYITGASGVCIGFVIVLGGN